MKRAATSNLADTHEIKKVTLGKSKTIRSNTIFYTESENKTAFLLLCILLLLLAVVLLLTDPGERKSVLNSL